MKPTDKITESQTAAIFGMDRRTVAKRLADLPFEDGERNSKIRTIGEVCRQMAKPSRETSSDRRNLAQARKAEIETAILERSYVPTTAVSGPINRFFSALQKEIDAIDFPPEVRSRIVARINSTKDELVSLENS